MSVRPKTWCTCKTPKRRMAVHLGKVCARCLRWLPELPHTKP